MNPRRVVITGLGALTPIGNTLPEYWEGLLSGTSGAAPISYFDPTLFKTQFACELKNFDPLDYFDRKEARKYDRFAQYALVSVSEALDDSNLSLEKIDNFINSFLRRFYTLSILLLRVFLGIAFIFHGKSKFPLPPQKLIDFFGFSPFLASFVAISEVLAGFGLIFSYFLKFLFF